MNTIWIVPLEPIEQRYTKQWYREVPKILNENIKNYKVKQLEIPPIPDKTTSGAFLDFAYTNVYKSTQLTKISDMFANGMIKSGDKFLFTDAWNPTILSIKYMSELLGIDVEIHGIWHAGAYDPTDILGMKMSTNWAHNTERALFFACDYNYFATDFHKNMFLRNLIIPIESHNRALRSGQPYSYLPNTIKSGNKENMVVFTHRLNGDKQPHIFRKIASDLKHKYDIDSILTQEHNLSKSEYYTLLGKAKVSFSCSLHENLGLGMIESLFAGAIPITPNRACYKEVYGKDNVYPSKWTANSDTYEYYRDNMVDYIADRVLNYDKYSGLINDLKSNVMQFITPTVMIERLDEK